MWNQLAGSLQQLRGMAFRLYIDGIPHALAADCSQTPTADGYPCSSRLPGMSQGLHTMAMAAVLNGVEGAWSASLRVNVTSSRTLNSGTSLVPGSELMSGTGAASTAVQATSVAAIPNDAAASLRDVSTWPGSIMACAGDVNPACSPTRVAAVLPGRALHLSQTPDGRLLFVEDDTRVRIYGTGGLIESPALDAGRATARIVGLAVDPAFEQTRSVFVAWTERVTSGEEALNITRYRELQGVLAQGATIVTGLPLRVGAQAPLVVDGSGFVYVALSANGNDSRPAAGFVLRYTRDGLTPKENLRPSPVMAYGYSNPTGLVFDGALGEILLSGEPGGWGDGVATLPVSTGSARERWPISPRAITRSTPTPTTARRFILKANRLIQVSGTAARGGRLKTIAFHPDLPALGVAAAGTSQYVSVSAGDESLLLQLSLP